MDSDNSDTPQKPREVCQTNCGYVLSKNKKALDSSSNQSYGGIANRKSFHPRTPNSVSKSCKMSGMSSPPAKRFSRVRNPFEAVLVERLHLPLICSPIIGSPSLFQKPATPPHSSTQFEWTIEEVSSLQPANVEAHETQFQDSPDPEVEAKAQSAISLYFKENQIVPSPVDCPLRNQRIILSEINGNTPISKSIIRKLRDNSTQTILSFPSILPKELEDALAPYLTYTDNQQNLRSAYPINAPQKNDDYEARDVSLRRKLFDMHNIIVVDNDSDVRILHQTATNNTINGRNSTESESTFSSRNGKKFKLSDSFDKDSFGSLSPISLSPSSGHLSMSSAHHKSIKHNFIEISEMEELSPIQPPRPTSRLRKSSSKNCSKQNCTARLLDRDNYRCPVNSSENTIEALCSDLTKTSNKFSPERSSSPVSFLSSAEMFVDSSFNIRVSRLAVDSGKGGMSTARINLSANRKATDNDINLFNETDYVDDDVMQFSQTSLHSNNSSSSSNTPHSKRRSANRKNLSHSFSAICGDVSDADDEVVLSSNFANDFTKAKTHDITLENFIEKPIEASSSQSSAFCRTDSGFNEMTTTQDGMQFKSIQKATFAADLDQIYMRCSTPSTTELENF